MSTVDMKRPDEIMLDSKVGIVQDKDEVEISTGAEENIKLSGQML